MNNKQIEQVLEEVRSLTVTLLISESVVSLKEKLVDYAEAKAHIEKIMSKR
jgi:hypothetical protein